VNLEVPVVVAGESHQFVLDTGSSITGLSPGLVRSAGLGAPTGKEQFDAGLNCTTSESIYKLASWSLGSLRLRPASVVSNQLPPGVDGLLGSCTLEQYSPIVLDFTDGAMLLGRTRAR